MNMAGISSCRCSAPTNAGWLHRALLKRHAQIASVLFPCSSTKEMKFVLARHPGRLSDLVSHVRTTFHPVTSNLV